MQRRQVPSPAMSSRYQLQVQAQPRYLPEQSNPDEGLHTFAYTIRIHNTGQAAAQVVARYWFITDSLGQTRQVSGLGVVGRQPVLQPGESFEYTSSCQLHTPSGSMRGHYFCVAVDGERFMAQVPEFALQAAGAPAQPGHTPSQADAPLRLPESPTRTLH